MIDENDVIAAWLLFGLVGEPMDVVPVWSLIAKLPATNHGWRSCMRLIW